VPPSSQPGQGPGSPLTQADFVVAGINDLVDTQTVRRVLGAPDSVSTEPDFRDSTTQWLTWHYKSGYSVFLAYIGRAEGVTISRPGLATARGLQLGESEAKVTELYGHPTTTSGSEWDYTDPGNDLHVVRITFDNRMRVSQIYVGHLID
jgi:hypothetical protein